MNKKVLIINILTAIFFISICVIPFITAMTFYFNHSKFLETAKLTEAIIINIERRNHSVDEDSEIIYFVEFCVDNKFYTGELNHYIEHKNMLVGYPTPIYYNPENPNEFTGTAKPDYLFGFHIIFLPFLFPAYILLYTALKPYLTMNLKKNGTLIYAKIIRAYEDNTYDNIKTYTIIASAPDPATGKDFRFRRNYIDFNIEEIIKENNITAIPVYVKPNDITKYYIDVESLKNIKHK